MGNPYTIRRVDTDDEEIADTIHHLNEVCFADEAPRCEIDLGAWWLVLHGNVFGRKPVAYAGLHPSKRYDCVGYLCRAGVLPEHRGNGLQRRLISVRERHARSLGWTTLVTDTTDSKQEHFNSANNLIREGFELYRPAFPWTRHATTLYWRKFLIAKEEAYERAR